MTVADALLFDLGNVVIDIDFNRVFARWAEHAHCDAAQVRARFKVEEAHRDHETGIIGDNAYFASLRDSLGLDLTNAQFLDGWNAVFVGETPGIADALARAAAHIPLYAFTNTNPAHRAYWLQHFPAAVAHFREIFVSFTIGLRKPDAAAFDFVVKTIGAPAERILFFDDSLANVEGARACGLQAVHVRSPADVTKTLAAMGL